MDMDVEKTERAEADLDRFINARSRQKNEANTEEELWRASERRVREKRRRENRQEWIDYYGSMHRVHLGIAEGHARRRAQLMAEAGYEPEDEPPGDEAA